MLSRGLVLIFKTEVSFLAACLCTVQVINRVVGNDEGLENAGLADNAKRCFVLSAQTNSVPPMPFVWRNYHYHEGEVSRYPGTTQAEIWEAMRSTTAAPTYFPEYIDDRGVRHKDGGLVANNPAAVSLHEARRLWCVVCLSVCLPGTNSNLGHQLSPGVLPSDCCPGLASWGTKNNAGRTGRSSALSRSALAATPRTPSAASSTPSSWPA
eukprot:SAG22_NODE_862_length_6808_cov_3.881204_5_plen_210_part_00